MESTNKFARAAIAALSRNFKSKAFGCKLNQNLLRAGMMKDRCRASGKLSDMY